MTQRSTLMHRTSKGGSLLLCAKMWVLRYTLSTMEEVAIECPFCWESFTISLAAEDGEEQSFVYDCEVCCKPINVKATYDEETEWLVVAEKGEGFD